MIASVRYAVRTLRRSPAFSLTVIATLAIGIGLNAAIFTVVDCVLLKPLGYHDADRIVGLESHFVTENRSIPRLGGDDYVDLAHQVKGLEATAYYRYGWDGIRLSGEALYVRVAGVSPAFGTVMGVQTVAGRLFASGDTTGHEALVSAAFAREHFGSARGALDKLVQYGGELRPIVGVLPDGFSFPGRASVWFEADARPETPSRTSYSQMAIGKRRAGVTPEQLSAELATFSRQLQNAFPEDQHKVIQAVPLQEQIVGTIRPTLKLLTGSVAVILLIICANITHLQLVRSTRQLRTVTIRTALGASRTALAGRALLEALLLAATGCLCSLLLAVPALKLLLRIAPPDIARLADVHLNKDVVIFSFVLSAILMGLTAVLPVWRSWHTDPASALRQDSSRSSEGRSTARLRNGLLIAEVALTLTLSVTAILLTRQLIQQSKQDLGFSAENLVLLDTHTISATSPPTQQEIAAATPEQIKAYEVNEVNTHLEHLETALSSVASVPGVTSVAAISGAPMGFESSGVGYAVKGRQIFAPGVAKLPYAALQPITPSLFSTMQIPLLRGRNFTAQDTLDAPMVLIINQALARQVFPDQNPIGQQIMCGYDEHSSWWTIVGVVADIRSESPATPPSPNIYVPLAQHPDRTEDVQIVARTRIAPASMLDSLRRQLGRTHPEIAIKATTMRADIGDTQRTEDFRTILFGGFAFVSILLAAVGMYGVTAYAVVQQRFEFGLRLALGADRSQLFGMVLGRALLYASTGIGIGIALSLGLTRLVANIVGALPAFDATAYLLAMLALLTVTLLATFLPARAAAHVDPMSVLRSE